MKTTTRALLAATATTAALIGLSACGGHGGTGSISPRGTTHGTFRYCSYTPDGDGIEISHHEATPCVVNDTRNKSERKPHAHTTTPTGYAVHAPSGSTTAKATTSKPKTVKVPAYKPKPKSR